MRVGLKLAPSIPMLLESCFQQWDEEKGKGVIDRIALLVYWLYQRIIGETEIPSSNPHSPSTNREKRNVDLTSRLFGCFAPYDDRACFFRDVCGDYHRGSARLERNARRCHSSARDLLPFPH